MEGGPCENDTARVWDPEAPATAAVLTSWLLPGAWSRGGSLVKRPGKGAASPGERREMYACVSQCWGWRVSGSQRSHNWGAARALGC